MTLKDRMAKVAAELRTELENEKTTDLLKECARSALPQTKREIIATVVTSVAVEAVSLMTGMSVVNNVIAVASSQLGLCGLRSVVKAKDEWKELARRVVTKSVVVDAKDVVKVGRDKRIQDMEDMLAK